MTASHTTHGTLAAATVTTVPFALNFSLIEIVNRGPGDIFATTNGTAPTVGGDDCYVVPATSAVILVNDTAPNEPGTTAKTTSVKLISSGVPAFSVSGKPSQRAY